MEPCLFSKIVFEALVLAGFLKGSNRLNKRARNHRLASCHALGLTHCLFCKKNLPPPGGLEPPTFRLTAERASRLRHGGKCICLSFDTCAPPPPPPGVVWHYFQYGRNESPTEKSHGQDKPDLRRKILRQPGVEPGSTAWKAAMLTVIPLTLHATG